VSRLRRSGDREAGYTVVEMAVVLMLIGIVMASMLRFLYSTLSVTSQSNKDVRAEESLELAMRTMTEDLRSASVLSLTGCGTSGYATCVTIDTPRSASPALSCPQARITYALSGTVVNATRVDFSSSCVSTATYTNKAVLSSVSSTSTLFTYYDKSGNLIDPVSAAASVPTAASVSITVGVSYTTGSTPTLTLTSVAALRNNR
jgi:type II secretory pathway component PulJ